MTLEGAIKLSETNQYIIYTMNSVTTGQYGVVVPKNINGTLNIHSLIRNYYEKLYANKLDNLEETDQIFRNSQHIKRKSG